MYDIELDFTDGSSIRCKILGSFFVSGREYALLLGQDKTVYIYRLEKLGNKKCKLTEVLDQKEFEQVVKAVRVMCDKGSKDLRPVK